MPSRQRTLAQLFSFSTETTAFRFNRMFFNRDSKDSVQFAKAPPVRTCEINGMRLVQLYSCCIIKQLRVADGGRIGHAGETVSSARKLDAERNDIGR